MSVHTTTIETVEYFWESPDGKRFTVEMWHEDWSDITEEPVGSQPLRTRWVSVTSPIEIGTGFLSKEHATRYTAYNFSNVCTLVAYTICRTITTEWWVRS